MTIKQSFKLNTGAEIPAIGLGTWQSTDQEGLTAVKTAIQSGYRHIDMAWRYGNERAVGEGIKASGVPRSELFLTNKIWGTYHSRAQEALDMSLRELGIGYLDLWLMHWPISFNAKGNDPGVPKLPDGAPDLEPEWDFLQTWRSMETIFKAYPTKVKAIGVSNFSTNNLTRLLEMATIVPAVNQVELHPSLPQEKLARFCAEKGIQLVAHSPLGSPDSELLSDVALLDIAEKHGKTAAQCLISWGVKKGWAVLPKSSSPVRIISNLETCDLEDDEIKAIDAIGRAHPKRYVSPVWAFDIWHDDLIEQ